MKQDRLSKSKIMAHRQCPKRLWLRTYRPELLEEDAGSEARMAVGTHAGEIAQGLFPQGVLIDRENRGKALADTQRALAEKPRRPIFEAGFKANGVMVFVDLLLPANKGYRLAEVKSSTEVKDYHYEDAAIQAWVAKEAGISISKVEIAHIDNTFVYQGDGEYKGLFHFASITKDIRSLVSQVPKWAAEARKTLSGDEPNISPGDQCKNPYHCPFENHCTPAKSEDLEPSYPPETLAYGGRLAATLRAEGYNDLRDIPEDRLEKPKHQRQRRVALNGRPELDPEAGETLRSLPYPRYYLDFETIEFVVPIWNGTRPRQVIPFQWSCHSEQEDGTVNHQYFLADGFDDPRKAFVESMLVALGRHGPIFHYHHYEKTCINGLIDAFPQMAQGLSAIIDRLVDLLPIARAHYYHQDMHGSWSLKSVIPTIAPELSYDEMEVGDGGAAPLAFTEILAPDTADERRDSLRRALLDYCERDTLALVKIAHYFQKKGDA